jgi:hypothetical protein
MIDNYNHHMNGVDIADQLRGYYTTHLTTRRNWVPLFFWLLDTVLVNCHLISKLKGRLDSQVEFRQELLWSLIRMAKGNEVAIPTQPSAKRARITKNSTTEDLPAARLRLGNHFPIYNPQRKACVWCSLESKNDEDKKGWNVPESYISCELCDVHLCLNKSRNCFKAFHSLDG